MKTSEIWQRDSVNQELGSRGENKTQIERKFSSDFQRDRGQRQGPPCTNNKGYKLGFQTRFLDLFVCKLSLKPPSSVIYSRDFILNKSDISISTLLSLCSVLITDEATSRV